MDPVQGYCELIEEQFRDYQEMLAVGLGQRTSLEHEDFPAVDRAFVRVHELMDRTRRRQSAVMALDRSRPEVAEGLLRLDGILADLQDLRRANQGLATQLRDRVAADIRQLGQGRQAFRSQSVPPPGGSHLFDATR